jgi:hypothetical protein
MILITASDVQSRLSVQAYTRLFARSGGSAVDTGFRDLCISEANSRASMICIAAFPSGFDAAGGSVDEGIKGLVVDICCGIAASRHASSDPTMGAYAKNKGAAEEMLRALNRDRDARPVTSASGRARPRAANVNLVDASGNPSNPLVRVADGTDPSDF